MPGAIDFKEEKAPVAIDFTPEPTRIDFEEATSEPSLRSVIPEPGQQRIGQPREVPTALTAGQVPSEAQRFNEARSTLGAQRELQQQGQPPAEIGSKPATLPRIGEPGTFVGEASGMVAGLGEWAMNNPDEFIASLWPPTALAVAAKYAPGIVKQAAEDVPKALKGDTGAMGRLAALTAMVLGPKGIQEARAKFLTEGKPAAPLPNVDEVARAGMSPSESFLPRSSAELNKPESEVQSASKIRESKAFYGDVRPSQVEGERQVPVDESGSGVQPQTEGRVPEETVAPTTLPQESPAGTEVKTQAEIPPETGPGLVGMGGALEGEVATGEGSDIHGVAARVRKKMAEAGQEADPGPGVGISAEESVKRGRELKASGADPEAAMQSFEQTGKMSSDDMALARAHAEELAKASHAAEDQFGTDSPEWRAAYEARSKWAARTKAMQTEWHKGGMAQQGEVDIDTGSWSGLRLAVEENTGRPATPKQEQVGKQKAQGVKQANTEAASSQEAFSSYTRKKTAETDAERAAIKAASQVVIDWAAKKAELERKQAVLDASRKSEIDRINQATEEKVKAAADRRTRDAAIKAGKKELKDAQRRADLEKKQFDQQTKAERKAIEAANAVIRRQAIKGAQSEAKDLEARADVRGYAWQKAREYIESGMGNLDDVTHKIATDMGLSVREVAAALGKDARAKVLMRDAWEKQQKARLLRQNAKRWVYEQSLNATERTLKKIPDFAFGAKVAGHGTVALGTHAPMVAFQPAYWKVYTRDFAKMYRMVGLPTPKRQAAARAFYESQIQDLVRRDNYSIASQSGLQNDPFQFEDYTNPETSRFFGKVSNMGGRGYTILKILRQDMFDQQWNKLPKTSQIPEVSKALARDINHVTGVVQGMAPKGSNLLLFAPRLEASRVMWLYGDPLRAANTLLHWDTADLGARMSAVNQLKEKLWVAGTMASVLAANAGFLSYIGSKQQINFTDPLRSDWLKFKIAGVNIAYGSAMETLIRLPARLIRIRQSDGGKAKYLVYPDEKMAAELFHYARSQMSPFASIATSLFIKSDPQERPLPNSSQPMPKRLAAQGIKPYTWPEFWAEAVLPIPAEEALKEVWQGGMHMTPKQMEQARKALLTISFMTATGGRMSDDIPYRKP